MTVCRIASAVLSGLEVQPIGVEVDVRRGMPNFTVVGMAQEALRECRDRVVAAIKNAGFEMPTMKVTVNLTPVSMKKTSPLLDLPIAVGVLAASKQIPPPAGAVFLGELSLDGTVRTVPGALAILDGLDCADPVVLPESNLPDAALLASSNHSRRHPVRGLAHLSGLAAPIRDLPSPRRRPRPARRRPRVVSELDFSEIRGQHMARRAAEISAAGGHHLI
ncbi:ATP-binding protein, partial [bacterium]|nr:ATP-binding protein [bacterium]